MLCRFVAIHTATKFASSQNGTETTSAHTGTQNCRSLNCYEALRRLRMVHRFEWQLRLLRRYESAQTDTNISGDLDRYGDLRWLRVVQIILVVETVTKICIISDLWRLRERVEGQA